MLSTDRGTGELGPRWRGGTPQQARRAAPGVADAHPEHEIPVEQPATRPARLDHETDDSEDA